MKFYYTFGTNEKQPYCGGWVEVIANSIALADKVYSEKFPDIRPGVLNCAGRYTEQEFQKTGFKEKGNLGAFCHCTIDASKLQPYTPPVEEDDVAEFIGHCIDIFENFLDEKGIEIDNPEKEESESPAIIYGTDYGILSDELREVFSTWGVISKEGSVC